MYPLYSCSAHFVVSGNAYCTIRPCWVFAIALQTVVIESCATFVSVKKAVYVYCYCISLL